MAMSIGRMLDQNVYYFMVSGLRHGTPEFTVLNYVAGWPANIEEIKIPSVAITRNSSAITDFELGTTNVARKENFLISAFCSSDGQRDDVGERVKEIFDNTKKQFLDFNQGFSGGQASLGIIHFDFLNMRVIHDLDSSVNVNKHRMDIEISAEYIYDILI